MPLEEHTFSVAETAFVTSLTKADINHEIDQQVIKPRGIVSGKAGTGAPASRGVGLRGVGAPALLYLSAIKPVRRDMSVALRKKVCRAFEAALRHHQDEVKVETVIFSVNEARQRIADRAARIERLHEVIEDADGIAGGQPVIKGTRIKPWLVADMLAAGTPVAEIEDEYDLTTEQVELAKLYSQLYPRRGRPRKAESRRTLTRHALPPR